MDPYDDIIAAAREGFLAEAHDNLRLFESSLLAMEQDPADAEAINSAFRAAHTIKGTAGLFGFNDVVAFTHEVESALDCMREGQLAVTEQAMALLLKGRDQMERLIEAIDEPTPSAELAADSSALGAELRALRGADDVLHPVAVATADPAATAGGVWHLSLHMGPDALRNGLDPLSFIRHLGTLGRVEGIRTLTERVPPLAELDAEGCALAFEIRLRTDAARETIAQVFDFLRDDSDLVLLAPDADSAAYEQLLQHRCGDDEGARAELLAHWQAPRPSPSSNAARSPWRIAASRSPSGAPAPRTGAAATRPASSACGPTSSTS